LNYFEILNIIPNFSIDSKELRNKFYTKSLEFHPDRHGLSSDEEQSKALELSTLINTAFKVLSNEMSRMRHLLEISGIEFAEGKESVPQDFLMEVMDINEMIMDYKLESKKEGKEEVFKLISSLKSKLLNNIDDVLYYFDYQKAEKKQLELIKDYYLKCKYLKRIESNLEN